MKRFEMITEADARLLEYGSTVVLAHGGHVTPLAADTLRSRRVTLVRDDGEPELANLAPTPDIRIVAVGGDHSSIALKAAIVTHLRGRGVAAHDLGTTTSEPVDYPDTASAVARYVATRQADAGIVIDGAGLGSTIAANKVDGVRAAMCLDQTLARYARQHNGANVLALGATLLSIPDALTVVDTFIDTPMREPRYIRRLAKIARIERA